jgi:hypothetical protein
MLLIHLANEMLQTLLSAYRVFLRRLFSNTKNFLPFPLDGCGYDPIL